MTGDQPVLVGVGAVQQRADEAADAVEALELMAAAVGAAAADAGAPALLGRLDAVLVPEGTWSYRDPGRLLAERYSPGARTIRADVGVLQQTLLTRACRDIAAGRAHVVLVCGGEARYRDRRAASAGSTAPETTSTGEPGEVLAPDHEIITTLEIERAMAVPAHQYALIESALRSAAGLDLDAHRSWLAERWAGFSAVAAANPDAWSRRRFDAAFLAEPSEANPMVATPYTRYHCSQWYVDQAAALLLTSVDTARRVGVPEERWVHPLGAAESNAMVPLSRRADPHRVPAVALVGRALHDGTGVDPAAADHVELYSCFPSAVEVQVRELGIDPARELTVTGGMAFAGGPLNNAALQSLVTLARVLRADPGSVGLHTSLSGMLTKHGAALWSTEPPSSLAGFRATDVSAEAVAATATVTVDPDHRGDATVVAATAVHARGIPARALVLADIERDGGGGAARRAVAVSDDPGLAAAVAAEEWCGRRVSVAADRFSA